METRIKHQFTIRILFRGDLPWAGGACMDTFVLIKLFPYFVGNIISQHDIHVCDGNSSSKLRGWEILRKKSFLICEWT